MVGQKITRNRPIKSCRYCYEHKLKCNKGRPCSTCIGLNVTDQCLYGFIKSSPNVEHGTQRKASHINNTEGGRVQKPNSLNTDSVIYKSKFFYPFFTSSINDRIITADHYSKVVLDSVLTRNEVTKFDRYSSPARNIDDVLVLLPSSRESALSQIETFFDCVHPIIPIFDQSKINEILLEVYQSLKSEKSVNALNVLLLMAIFFCSSYVAVASGVIPDLLLCNNYYKAYRYLLDIAEFPMRPLLESLQAFVVVNFVVDPNMVDATAYSAMLVRMGQQLGLHKTPMDGANHIKLLWNFLLYIEGSSSVVCGFSFSTPSNLMDSVPLPDVTSSINSKFPILYTVGRCKINTVFRHVMELTSKRLLFRADLDETERRITKLYKDVCLINHNLRCTKLNASSYFASTLNIFVYRLHLRYCALICLHSEKDKILPKTSAEIAFIRPKDVTGILEVKQVFKEEVIHLSILLLFHTYKRLIQSNIDKYVWYTKGSTVMQYLFVLIKDIYQNPVKHYRSSDFVESIQQTIDTDIRDIIDSNAIMYKYVLVEAVLGLMESKLASLWNNEDLYKFLLVKMLKEKVWETHEKELKVNKEAIQILKKRGLFGTGMEHLLNMKNINFEECLNSWDHDKTSVDLEKILNNWLMDFNQR